MQKDGPAGARERGALGKRVAGAISKIARLPYPATR